MRIYTTCFECADWTADNPFADDALHVDIGELTDDGFAVGKCPRGHEVHATVQVARHVLLFDSACLALMDGYSREAIGSFAASLERFHEFVVRVVSRHRGMTDEAIDATWKLVAKRSEAQEGAFMFLYSQHLGKAIEEWPHRNVRNGVIHDGKLPTTADAMLYGEACYHHILDVTDELRRTAKEALERESTMQFIRRAQKVPPGNRHTTIGPGASPVAVEYIRHQRQTFLEALTFLSRYPMWVRQLDRLKASQIADEAGVGHSGFLQALQGGGLLEHVRQAVAEATAGPARMADVSGEEEDRLRLGERVDLGQGPAPVPPEDRGRSERPKS